MVYNLAMKGEFDDHKAQVLKEKKYPHQGKETRRAQRREIKKGQQKNILKRHEHGEKTPEEEIDSVLRSLKRRDGNDLEMKATNKYIDWLTERMTEKEFDFEKESFSDFEMMTASVRAGGSGRQTAKNSRARTHLITGIRAKSEQDRKAYPNEEAVMKKLEGRIKKHLNNWRVIISANQDLREYPELIGEEVLSRMQAC